MVKTQDPQDGFPFYEKVPSPLIKTHFNNPKLFSYMIGEHSDIVTAMTTLSKPSELATAGGDHNIKIWDINTKRFMNVLKGHKGMFKFILNFPKIKLYIYIIFI